MVFNVCFSLVMKKNSCSRLLGFNLDQLNGRLFSLACITYIFCLLSLWKTLAQGCWSFELIQKNIGWLDCRLFSLALMVCTVWFLSWWKIFAQCSWNFEFVQIYLINRIDLLGTHGVHCLFTFVMESSCSSQLKF